MTERAVYLADWQVRAWLAGNLSVLFVPVRPQPRLGKPWVCGMAWWVVDPDKMDVPVGLAPFHRGNTLLGKERWDYQFNCEYGIMEYLYGDECISPKSPVTMPRDAVRIRMTVVSVGAVRIAKIWAPDAEAAGIPREFPYSTIPYIGDDSNRENDRCVVSAFRHAWDDRYGSRYPWDTAWAWRVEVSNAD